MNSKFVVGLSLALVLSSSFARTDENGSTQVGNVIDITKAVRDAGKGTTTLDTGNVISGYTVANAFGDSETNADRVMLSTSYNRILWTVADDFEPTKPIVVTKYTIKRTCPDSNTPSPYGEKRAPITFYLQGSNDGTNWTNLDYQRNLKWTDAIKEMTFEIEPHLYMPYRRYRFTTVASNADATDTAKCAFQYIKLYGTMEPGELTGKKVDYIVQRDKRLCVTQFKPTLDSKVVLDVMFNDVSGTQAIFASTFSGTSANNFRLFVADGVWTWNYDGTTYKSSVKAVAYARYHVVIDGANVTVNGVKVIDNPSVAKLTATAAQPMILFASYGGKASERYNNLKDNALFYGLKVTDATDKTTFDLEPIVTADGGGALRDKVTGKVYLSDLVQDRLTLGFPLTRTDKNEIDVTASVRREGYDASELINVVEGEANASYPVTNLITRDETTNGRAIFTDARNVIRYDIPDDYNAGWPIVLTRFALIPCVGSQSDRDSTSVERAPLRFKLEGSKDGETWVTLQDQSESDVSFANYAQGPLSAAATEGGPQGLKGFVVEIPEANRGDYRHYRFTSLKTAYTANYKMALQEIRLFGYVGGFEMRQTPIEYVQNGSEDKDEDNTYFKTDVAPAACNMTVEIAGEFTRVGTEDAATSCLFCSRGAGGANSWTLFLLKGQLRLDCNGAGTPTTFTPEANKTYVFRVEKNKLYVDNDLKATTGSDTSFKPGSSIVLLSSHNNLAGFGNQARFKLRSCKIMDETGALVRDYVPVVRSDGMAGLFDRVTGWFKASSGSDPKAGPAIDIDFCQRERAVAMTAELENGRLPDGPLTFAFGGNQRVGGKLYATFDNKFKGNVTNDWAKVVKIADVKTGVDTLVVQKPENPEGYRRVKFFVCDALERGVSHTRSYKTDDFGSVIIVR